MTTTIEKLPAEDHRTQERRARQLRLLGDIEVMAEVVADRLDLSPADAAFLAAEIVCSEDLASACEDA